jgi:hypothetical protein
MNRNTDCKTCASSMRADGALSRTSPHGARSQSRLSRRACLAVLAGSASAVLEWNVAQAQDVWREFRRNDAGFRIEMPGDPEVDDDKGLPTDPWIRVINARVEYEQIAFDILYIEFKQNRSEEEWFRGMRDGLNPAFKMVAETPLTMSGFQGREIIAESAELKLDAVYRSFVVLNNSAIISVSAIGAVANPNARRFLDSFMLFRS